MADTSATPTRTFAFRSCEIKTYRGIERSHCSEASGAGGAYEISFCTASSHRERNSSRSPKRHHASEFGRHLRLWHRIKLGQPACSFFYKPQGTLRKRRCQLCQNKTRPLSRQLRS